MNEQSKGFDFVAIGFAGDGRAMLAITCATFEDAYRWAQNNTEYKWSVYNSNGFQLLPTPTQITFL